MSSEEKMQKDPKEGSARDAGAEIDRQVEALMAGEERAAGKKPKKKGRKKKLILAVLLLAVLGFGVKACLGGNEKTALPVAVVQPSVKEIENRLSVSGPVSGTDSVDVVSNLHAEILAINVKEGDRVEKGQVLAILDDADIKKEEEIAKNNYDLAVSTKKERERELQSSYEKAVQDLETARINYDRQKVLFDGGSIPQVDFEAAQNAFNDAKRNVGTFTVKNGKAVAGDSYDLQIEKAKYDYEKVQDQLTATQITAPISGTVVRVNTKVGRFADLMKDNEPLFIIENLDVLEMEIKVSEYSIGKVAVGQEAEISADILDGGTVRGEVISISPTGEEKGGGSTERVIPTKIRILDSDTNLIAGITARAEIILESAENALTIPISALFENEGNTYVQAVREGFIHWVPVTVGIEGDIEVQIIPAEGENLDETSQIVGVPNVSYAEGMAVTAMAQ